MDTKYAFHWRAQFTDGSTLKQFDENGEHGFGEIQDKEDALTSFWLDFQNNNYSVSIGVDLTDGSFNINDFTIEPMLDDVKWKDLNVDFRVIYFRRNRRHYTAEMLPLGHDIDYFIGWQTTYEGKNYKRILKIGADGTIGMS